jgi:hypothetical protein
MFYLRLAFPFANGFTWPSVRASVLRSCIPRRDRAALTGDRGARTGALRSSHQIAGRGGPPQRIGKEVDRLSEDWADLLDATDPTQYLAVQHTLEWAFGILEDVPATETAPQIPMSEKRLRDIRRGVVEPNAGHRVAMIRIAKCRENEPAS